MAFDALDKNFLLAMSALLTAWLSIAALTWVVLRWRHLHGRTSKNAEEAAECTKAWGIIMVVVAIVVAIVVSVLFVANNAELFRLCVDCAP
jgi:hypothetical protein